MTHRDRHHEALPRILDRIDAASTANERHMARQMASLLKRYERKAELLGIAERVLLRCGGWSMYSQERAGR